MTARLASGALIATRRGVLYWADPDRQGGSDNQKPTENWPASTGRQNLRRQPAFGAPADGLGLPLEVRAALLASPGRTLVLSHATAARLFGLPKPLAGWPAPEFTASTGPTRRRGGVQIRVAPLIDDDVIQLADVAVTSVNRTLADCLRTLPGRDSLAMIDAALHKELVQLDAVVETLRRQAGWPGVVLARRVLALADGRRESPLESWSAWAFAHAGVPTPQWQVEIRQRDGQLLGRVDCLWRCGVVGEADGRSKYALAAAERGGNAAAVFKVLQAERQREQALRNVGADLIRWTAADVITPSRTPNLARQILAALALADRDPRFTGIAAPLILPPGTSNIP